MLSLSSSPPCHLPVQLLLNLNAKSIKVATVLLNATNPTVAAFLNVEKLQGNGPFAGTRPDSGSCRVNGYSLTQIRRELSEAQTSEKGEHGIMTLA